jgi:hypothetical protein
MHKTHVNLGKSCTENLFLHHLYDSFNLGKSCNRYWNCQGGYPRLQRCPAMLVFDRNSLRCVVPPTSECDVPPTPSPLEEQPEGGQAAAERGQVNSIIQFLA